jgi:fluoride ion exporter CrcB/FEX
MWKSLIAISLGASLDALLRWWLGIQLNRLFPSIPPGTLAANLLGGSVAMTFAGIGTVVWLQSMGIVASEG